ncbi:hypothetical protein MMC11_006019 [Xylographa trunciseda]|nr:hypothetical protein [Xylographa trunciseda]
MVFLGLGILFASLTILLLRVPKSQWRETVQKWMWTIGGVPDKVSAKQNDESQEVDMGTPQSETPLDMSYIAFSKQGEVEKSKQEGHNLKRASPSRDANEEICVVNGRAPMPNFLLDDKHTKGQDGRLDLLSQSQLRSLSLSAPAPTIPSSPTTHKARPAPASTSTFAAPKTVPTRSLVSSRQLMPPPSARPTSLRPLSKLANPLDPPPSLASTLRGPPSRLPTTGSTSLLPATSSTLAPSARPSRKVILPPGHSPLDWAQLTSHPPTPTFLRGAGVPPQLIRVTPSQLRENNGRKGRDAWSTWQGKVYNITPYKKFHPGGEGELMRGAGKPGEAERLFMEIHPWVNWEGMLGECMVGILVGETEDTEKETNLEDMD